MLGRLKQHLARLPGIRSLYLRRRAGRPEVLELDGVSVRLWDLSGSSILPLIVREVVGEYALHEVELGPGDVVVDIGAHVGAVSVYLAKRHPYATVYAYEPVPSNYASLLNNVAANGVTNVRAFSLAVTGDGRDVEIDADLRENSGGGGIVRGRPRARVFSARSTTLDAIFADHGISRCGLLKIDCEGAEHEILRACRSLDRVNALVGEFHEDPFFRSQGHTVAGLEEYCARFIDRERMHIVRFNR